MGYSPFGRKTVEHDWSDLAYTHVSVTKHFYFAVTKGGKLGHSDWSLVSAAFFYFSSLFSQRFKASPPPLPPSGGVYAPASHFPRAGAENQWREAIKKKNYIGYMYNIIYETNRQSRFNAWYRMLGAGALGWPRGMVRRGRWEGSSGWGTRLYPWRIHVDVWQNQYNIVK